MALWKIFLVVVLAVLAAAIILRFWQYILKAFVIVITAIISVALIIVLLPIEIVLRCCGYYSKEKLQSKIVKKYDEIFFSVKSKNNLRRNIKDITKLERTLYQVKEKEREKETKKMLNECKWAL